MKVAQGHFHGNVISRQNFLTWFVFAVACRDLQDVQLSLFLPTARMLLTVTQASPAACRQVVAVVSVRKFVLYVATCRVQHFALPCFVPYE
jgi:hypothetical protein